jgi:hypothetical protein
METGAGVTWLVAGTIAAFVSALAAAASAIFSAAALRSQTRAVDVASYIEILKRHQQFERKLKASASVSEEWIFTRREYHNFLEGLAHLYIKRRFGSKTADLCRDSLANSMAAIEIYTEIMGVLADSVTSPEAFEYLAKFRKKHRRLIEERKAIFSEIQRQDARPPNLSP